MKSFYFFSAVNTIPPADSDGIRLPPHFLKPDRGDIPHLKPDRGDIPHQQEEVRHHQRQAVVDLQAVRQALANLDALVEKYPQLTAKGDDGKWSDNIDLLDFVTRDRVTGASHFDDNEGESDERET